MSQHEQADSFRGLLAYLRGAITSGEDAGDLSQRLSEARQSFTHLLQQQKPSAEARRAVQSGNPQLPDCRGQIQLDQEPDIAAVLLMSDALQVNEMDCLLCLLTGHEESGEVSPEVAAGVFYQERRALLSSLTFLLTAAAAGPLDSEDATGPTALVAQFVGELLAERCNGSPAVVSRLLTLIKESLALEAAATPKQLTHVVDHCGAMASLATVVALERTLLVEALALAVALAPRSLAAADITSAVEVLRTVAAWASATKTAGGDVMTAQHQTYVVTVAVLAALLPMENAEGDDFDTDETALAALVTDTELAKVLEGGGTAGPTAVIQLAWGLLLAHYGALSAQDGAAITIAAATASGALTWLGDSFLRSVPFGDEAPSMRVLYSTTAHQLLMMLLDEAPGRDEVEHLTEVSIMRAEAEATSTPGHAASSDTTSAQADDLVSLLKALSAVYDANPQLWLDPELRYSILGDFMAHVASGDAVNSAPPVFCAYMGVLASLAADEGGAQAMYIQLRPANAVSSMVSWRRMFDFLLQICQLYSDMDGDTRGVGLDAVIQRDLQVLSDSDTSAVLAYLSLFSAVMRQGGSAAPGWLQQLEIETGVSPLWEVLFQLAAHPVPQEVKGGAWTAIAACVHSPETAVAAWQRLLQESVLAYSGRNGDSHSGSAGESTMAIPHYDMTYQLNEIEARAEDYTETLAFVRLLNVLASAGGGAAVSAEEGCPAAAFARHVRCDVLAAIHQRIHTSPSQKWDIIAAAAVHLRLTLLRLPSEMQQPLKRSRGGGPDTSALPGTEVLLDMLGSQGSMRAVVAALSGGAPALAAARVGTAEGAAREGAALECLRLLRTAFSVDVQAVQWMRASEAGLFSSLDEVLAADPVLVAQLLGFVRYAHNPAIQLEGLRLTATLSSRLTDLLPLLATAGESPADLIDGFARCLDEALFPNSPYVPTDDCAAYSPAAAGEGAEVYLEGADSRACAVLKLLMSGLLEGPIPGLPHLLLGYHVGDGPTGCSQTVLDIRAQLSCLTVILRCVSNPCQLSQRQPGTFEAMLLLLAALASEEVTSEPLMQLLRSQCDSLEVIVPVICGSLPSQDSAKTASLQQRAAALRLYAALLHATVPAVPLHRTSAVSLIRALFGRTRTEESEGGSPVPASDSTSPCLNPMLMLLEALVSAVDNPELATASSPQMRRAQQSLGIVELLGAGTLVSAGGVRIPGPHVQQLYDIEALTTILKDRYQTATSGGGAAQQQALQDACRQALLFAQRSNAFSVAHTARWQLVRSWQAVVEIVFSERFAQLTAAMDPAVGLLPAGSSEDSDDGQRGSWPGGALGLLLTMARAALSAVERLVTGGGGAGGALLAGPLCQVVHTLVAVVRTRAARGTLLSSASDDERAMSDDPNDVISGDDSSAASVAEELLAIATATVEIAGGARRPEGIRLPLHGTLLNIMAMAGGGAYSSLTPAAIAAVMDGSGAQPDAGIDRLRGSMEAGLPACLARGQDALVDSLAADALPGGTSGLAGRTTALTLLAAIVAAGGRSGDTTAGRLYAIGLPTRLLMDLAAADDTALSTRKGQGALLGTEAALRLLLRLAVMTSSSKGGTPGRPAAAHRLFALNAIPRLAQCRLLDAEWETIEWSSSSATRTRILQVVSPALQVVLAIVMQLSDSASARGQLLQFVEAHGSLLVRLMDDAADGHRMGHVVAPVLGAAQLAVGVLCHAIPAVRELTVWGLLQPPLFRLAWLYGRLNIRVRDPVLGPALQSRPLERIPPSLLLLGPSSSPADEAVDSVISLQDTQGGTRASPAQKVAVEVKIGARRLRLAVAQALQLLSADGDTGTKPARPGAAALPAPMSWGYSPHAASAPVSHRPPTLPLLREMLSQATEDLYEALDERHHLLHGSRDVQDGLDPVVTSLATAANVESQVADLILIVENLLATFCAVLPRGQVAGRVASERDLDQLGRLMTTPLDALIGLPIHSAPFSEDAESLRLLARAVKGLVMRL